MAASNYERSLALTLKYEGGYTNHPSDPGGPTNWGITIHDARRYWKRDVSALDVRNMPLSVAQDIYRTKYWAAMKCDDDPKGVDFVTFDYGVNSGIGRAVPCRDKFSVAGKPVESVKAICKERLRFLKNLKTWSVFGKGWGSRVANAEANGVKMALEGLNVPAPEIKKELKKEAEKAKVKADDHATGVIVNTAGTTTTQVPNTPHHFDFNSLDFSHKTGVIVAGLGLSILLLWSVWHWWQHRQRANAYRTVANS